MIKLKIKLIIFALVLFVVSIVLALWIRWERPLVSPISSNTSFRFTLDHWLRKNQTPAIIYGFLPYWNLNIAQINPKLSHISYFALTIGPDGGLETEGDSESLAGYRGLQSDAFLNILQIAKQQGAQLELVLKQFSNSDAQKFLISDQAHTNLFGQLDSLILAYPISGINLDFELSEVNPETQTQFTQFVKTLREHLNAKYKDFGLSVDVYASAGQGKNLWNIASLEPYVDWFVIMAYDFHQRNSPQAGPVAPLISARKTGQNNINAYLKEFLEQVSGDKILLGIPFYGYEWQTDSRNQDANTYPDSGVTISYQKVQEILEQKTALKVKESWNDDHLVPYLSYEKDNKTYTIYYENSHSLEYKIDYVNQLNLAGIAIWALGYEGDSNQLWQVISDKL